MEFKIQIVIGNSKKNCHFSVLFVSTKKLASYKNLLLITPLFLCIFRPKILLVSLKKVLHHTRSREDISFLHNLYYTVPFTMNAHQIQIHINNRSPFYYKDVINLQYFLFNNALFFRYKHIFEGFYLKVILTFFIIFFKTLSTTSSNQYSASTKSQ